MRVFVTGATGFIGQPLIDSCLRRGWQVTALVRKPESAEGRLLTQKGVEVVQGDVTDVASMRGPMTGADVVIHNAGWYEIGIGGKAAQAQMQAVNVDGTRNTLTLAHELGVPRIVHVSSIVAIGHTGGEEWDESNPRQAPAPNVYERTKTEAHEIARDLISKGAPVMIGMPGAVFGPGDHANLGVLQRMYVRGMAPPMTIGHGGRSYVYVDDCAECVALIAEKGRAGESYLICNEWLTYADIAELMDQTPGGMKSRFMAPSAVARVSGVFFEYAQRLFGLPNLLSLDAAVAADFTYRFSGNKARRELGWQPGDVRQQWLETMAEERRRATQGRDLRATGPDSAAA